MFALSVAFNEAPVIKNSYCPSANSWTVALLKLPDIKALLLLFSALIADIPPVTLNVPPLPKFQVPRPFEKLDPVIGAVVKLRRPLEIGRLIPGFCGVLLPVTLVTAMPLPATSQF